MKSKTLYIIGVSRTGSKFYMQLLNSHQDIYIAPELMFRHPIKKDMYSAIIKFMNETDNELLIKTIYELNLKDTYKDTLQLVAPEILKEHLSKIKNKTPYNILDKILEIAATAKSKKNYGAKFPIHFSYTKELLSSFDDSLVLYLTRDPREIYFSDYVKKRKEQKSRGNNFPIKGILLKPAVLFYSMSEWKKSIQVYENLKEDKFRDRIKLFKYEDILVDEKKVIKNIAEFIDEKPEAFSTNQMKIIDSSFSKKPELNSWKQNLNFLEKLIFKIAIGRKMKKYGYQ